MEINPEVIQINRKKIQLNSYVVSAGDEMVIIFDDSDNNKLFEYTTVNDCVKFKTNGSSNFEKGYKNSSFKFNTTKSGIRYFSHRECVKRVFGFKLKQICRQFFLKFWIMIIYDWCSDVNISCRYFYIIFCTKSLFIWWS